jgi:hypothetical protein
VSTPICGSPIFGLRRLFPVLLRIALVWHDISEVPLGLTSARHCRRPGDRRYPADKGGDVNIALVDLAEGPRMMSRVEGVAPDQVKIGTAVKARIAELNGEPAIVFDVA